MHNLPAADLGIMAEHLSAHKGIIHKLNVYQRMVQSPQLKKIIRQQANAMQGHVHIMLAFIDPAYHEPIEVPPLYVFEEKGYENWQNGEAGENDQWIALEVHSTAKQMADDNFSSALMMKDMAVRNAHVEMALQQTELLRRYDAFLEEMGWMYVPLSDIKSQQDTYRHFYQAFYS
ncbi:hypothetical protein [Virgibacillus senegalensis]|uniref:hypothetical protein n=1 Tax=Virgibacillus senegalensis TaxID=1499679 RepID=UPI00069E8477|nr:hypothetical protein [Virgibacillus senegalensis]